LLKPRRQINYHVVFRQENLEGLIEETCIRRVREGREGGGERKIFIFGLSIP